MKRYAAPVAFLAAVTIAVLLLRSTLHHTHAAAPPATSTRTTTTRPHRAKHVKPKAHVRVYTVRSGDTLGSIATKEGTTVARLEQLNPGVDPAALQVGQKIRVQ